MLIWDGKRGQARIGSCNSNPKIHVPSLRQKECSMKGTEDTSKIDRYIALDIHKEYVLAGGQTAGQEWVLPPRRISMTKFREWATANLHEGDAVVIETTTNVWDIYVIVAPQATR